MQNYGIVCENIKGIFSQDVSGHCNPFDVSKLSWSLAIDQIIVDIDVKSFWWGYC